MIKNLKLGAKFSLFLAAALLIGAIVSGLIVYHTSFSHAESEVASNGMFIMEMMNSVRQYMGERIMPYMNELPDNGDFIPEKVPSFSTRVIFGGFRSLEDYRDYRYKEASLDPRNPVNSANAFEATLITDFIDNPGRKELSGFHNEESGRLYYIARPLVVTSTSCLACHDRADNAPASMVEKYGSKSAFGWKVGNIIAAQIVYVPASLVYQDALGVSLLIILIMLLTLAAVIYLINQLIKNNVLKPINVLSDVAEKIHSHGLMSEDLESEEMATVTERKDELGQLSRIFQRTAHEVYIRAENMKREIMQLRIEIDQVKRSDHVQDVIETDFFKRIKNEARLQRDAHDKDNTA